MRLQDGTLHTGLQRRPGCGHGAAVRGGAAVCAGVTGALGCAERPLPAVTCTVPGARLGTGFCPGGISFGAAHLGGLQDTFPPGLPGTEAALAGAAPEPLGGPTVESGPAATGEAGSDLEAIAGSRRCRETTCPCLLRREAQRAQGRCRRSPAPRPCPGTTPLRRPPGWQSTRAVREPPRWRGCVGRGSGAVGLQPDPFTVVPPGLCLALGPCLALHGMGLGKWLLSGAVPAPGQGCPAHEEVFGLALCRERPVADCSEHPVQSVLRPRGSCCQCLGFAVPMARGKLLLLASPCEAFPSFCLPADVLRLSCSLGLAGAYCHCVCDRSAVWSHQSLSCPQPQQTCHLPHLSLSSLLPLAFCMSFLSRFLLFCIGFGNASPSGVGSEAVRGRNDDCCHLPLSAQSLWHWGPSPQLWGPCPQQCSLLEKLGITRFTGSESPVSASLWSSAAG